MSKGKKAPNGSGSVWQRPDGRWGAALSYPYYDPEEGRTRTRRTSTTKTSWEDAHKWLVQKQIDLLGGVPDAPENPTVGEYLYGWLADVVEPSVAPKTHEKRSYHVCVHLAPAIGHLRLKDLQSRQIHTLYVRMARRESQGLPALAYSTRRDIHTTLKMSLKQAVRWGIIPQNPAEFVDPPKPAETDEDDDNGGEVRALTEDQAVSLFEMSEGKRWHCYYVAAIRTGLRPGELLGLRWGDLELGTDPGSLRVRRTLAIREGGGFYFKPPKSKASRRTLALHWEAAEAFDAQAIILGDEGPPTRAGDLVFPSTIGTPMKRNNLRFPELQPDLAEPHPARAQAHLHLGRPLRMGLAPGSGAGDHGTRVDPHDHGPLRAPGAGIAGGRDPCPREHEEKGW
jgi:integrase